MPTAKPVKPSGEHEARVHAALHELGRDRRHEEHAKPGDEHRLADLQRRIAAHAGEIDGVEIGEPVKADAEHEGEERARRRNCGP